MEPSPQQAASGRLANAPQALQWAGMLMLSVLLAAILELAGFPAALLIGPMLAAVAFGVNGARVAVPASLNAGAMAVVGCLIAASISPEFLPALLEDWALFLATVVATLAASSLLGWTISRLGVLPGTAGVWGSAPGAATAMVLMAGAFGADQRLVAFMQYYRMILVTAAAALVARLWVGGAGAAQDVVWFPPVEWQAVAATLGVAAAGAVFGRLARLPSPYFLGPLVLGLALKLPGLVEFQFPEWLLAVSYAAIGWTIGSRFRHETIVHIGRALPQVTLAIVALMAFCGTLAFLLWEFAGVDPLTAYLATSPGGLDSVAIIAAASGEVDISFVMVLQMLRFLLVLLFGPAIARTVAGWVKSQADPPS